MARSPVVPVGNGAWVPSVPPWAEYRGPVALYAEGGNWFTHGVFGGRDSLIGALYLVISEVLDAHEIGTQFMLKMHPHAAPGGTRAGQAVEAQNERQRRRKKCG